jgi:hypothetical protein
MFVGKGLLVLCMHKKEKTVETCGSNLRLAISFAKPSQPHSV